MKNILLIELLCDIIYISDFNVRKMGFPIILKKRGRVMNRIKKAVSMILAITALAMVFTACDKDTSPSDVDKNMLSSTVNNVFEAGIDLYNNGDYEEAVMILENAVRKNPERAEIYIALADAYVAVDRGNYAVTALKKSLDVVENKDAVNNKIELLKKRGYGDSSIVDILKEEKFDADNNLIYSMEYFYDDFGKIIKKTSQNSDGKCLKKIVYKYDKNNLLIKETTYGADKSYQGHNEYSYNDNKLLDHRVVVNNTGRFEFQYTYNNNVLSSVAFGHELGEGRYEYTYDDKGNMIHEKWYDHMQDGNLVGTYDYTYNDRNTLIKEVEYNPDGSVYSYTVYEEDEKGRAKNMAHHYPDGTLHINCDVNSYEYDNEDRLIKMGIYDKDANSRGYIIYTYDSIS